MTIGSFSHLAWLSKDITTMNTERPSGSTTLSDASYRALASLQASRGQAFDNPTATAIQAVLELLEAMLRGSEDPSAERYYLSSLDPGQGKTEAICTFLRTWRDRGFQPHGGVLVALSRVEEIEAYIDRSGLGDDEFAVLVSPNYTVSSRGKQDREQAPVLFTTQEQVRARCRNSDFASIHQFHFEGRPRSCRVWDETLTLGRAATMRLDAIQGLLEPVRPLSSSAASMLEGLIKVVGEAKPGERVTCPAQQAVGRELGPLLPPQARQHWATLGALGGQEVLVTESNYHGRELVGIADTLPDDFAPALILDASGRVRHTYRVWEASKGNLVRLPEAANDYGPLTVHLWDRPCSRSTFSDPGKREEILQSAAELLNREADTRWLVLHHLPRGNVDVPERLRRLLLGSPDRVRFLHWGNHHGTNAFREIDRILVMGLWHQAPATIIGLHQATAGDGSDGPPAKDDLERIEVGEHQHNLLQAICRGSVRNSSGGTCAPCSAYVIGRIGSNTQAILQAIFPGAAVQEWSPVDVPLSGHAARVAEVLQEHFTDRHAEQVPKDAVRRAVGLKRSQDLAQVLKRPDLRLWMAKAQLGTSIRHIVRLAA